MKILVGCEESQAVCMAFREKGHEAYSCDLLPCSGGFPEYHLQMDVLTAIIRAKEFGSPNNWDMAIYFPDCTYLTVSGLHWNKRNPERADKTNKALRFISQLYNLSKSQGIKKFGFENPVGCISTRLIIDNMGHLIPLPHTTKKGFKPSQIIQPYQFGEDASKATCLWLYGLPLLQPTEYYPPRIVTDPKTGKERPRWANQTDSGQNRLGPSEGRAEIRAKTYPGIARAMAYQWG